VRLAKPATGASHLNGPMCGGALGRRSEDETGSNADGGKVGPYA